MVNTCFSLRFKVKISTDRDLSRQVVKSDNAVIKVPEIDLEIPADSQKGGESLLRAIRLNLHHQAFFASAVTTVEGILQRTISGLEQDQPLRKALDPDSAEKIEDYIAKVRGLMELEEPFHLVRARGHTYE